MMNKLIAICALLSLTACGTMSMTRESPVVKGRHDFSVGGGLLANQTPYKGGKVTEEKKPGAAFAAFRFGITKDIEAMASGSAFLFAGSSFELRGKWRWYDSGKWSVASSAFFTTDNDTQQASSVTYTTTGEGVSTALGYHYSPAITPYAGAKVMQMSFRYRNAYANNPVQQTTDGMVGAGFVGFTYQFFLLDVPFDTDIMLSVAMLPKEVGNDTLAPYPMLTASFWWRH